MYFRISEHFTHIKHPVLFNNHVEDKNTKTVLLPVRLGNKKCNEVALPNHPFKGHQGIFQYKSQSHRERLLTALTNPSLAPQGTSHSGVTTEYNKSQ